MQRQTLIGAGWPTESRRGDTESRREKLCALRRQSSCFNEDHRSSDRFYLEEKKTAWPSMAEESP
jgi:hypothetical protein